MSALWWFQCKLFFRGLIFLYFSDTTGNTGLIPFIRIPRKKAHRENDDKKKEIKK